MFEGDQWGGLAVEVCEALRNITREALTDAWGAAPPGTITARTVATADHAAAGPRVDWFLYDLAPMEYRTGGDNATHVLGLTLDLVLSVEQTASGDLDEDAIRAFGAVRGRLYDRPLRVCASAVLGGAMVLQIERAAVTWAELRDVFAASDRPLARAAAYRVTIGRSSAPPDVTVPAPPARIVVVHGGTLAGRRAAVSALGAAADVDLDSFRSAYADQTEKALSAMLGAAAASGAVLLFDEADALFGRRTGVRDAHDRYAVLDRSKLPAGSTVVVTTDDVAVVKRLAARGAEVVQAPDDPE